MSARDAGKFAAQRAGTLGLYVLAVIGASGWDRNPNSWFLTLFRLVGCAVVLWLAVARTIRHYHEDREFDAKRKAKEAK